MKYLYKSVMMMFVALFASFAMTSCGDDDAVQNEWNATYVYLQADDYLRPEYSTFTLNHTVEGLNGNSALTFKVKTQKIVEKDIRVNLSVTGVEDFDASKVKISNASPVIKAGQSESEEITVDFVDRSFLESMEDAVEIQYNLSISGIETDLGNTRISSNLNTILVTVKKTALLKLEVGEPENSSVMDRSGWNITLQDGIEGTAANLVDNNRNTDVAANNAGFWLTIDLGAETKVSGIRTLHWGAIYCPTKIELSVSDDGATWKSLGVLDVSGADQYVKMLTTPVTRYIRYEMLSIASSRVDITEFYVYESN